MLYDRSSETVEGLVILSEGDDRLIAGSYVGATVVGLSGNDVFETAPAGGSFEFSSFNGGLGSDRLIIKSSDVVTGSNLFNGGEGLDTLELSSDTQITMNINSSGYVVSFGGANSTNSLGVIGVERYVIKASEFSDVLRGGSGDDYLDGRGGLDLFFGSAGNDSYVFDTVGERVVGELAGGGIDQIFTTVSVDLRDNDHVENLRLVSGDIDGTGNELANLITGSSGSNVIAGGLGNDTLYGKGGADIFAFAEFGAANRDWIWDYDADDRIQLDGTVFAGLDADGDGFLDSTAFTIGARAVGAQAQIVYNANTGFVSYDGDGDGAGAAQDIAFIGKQLGFVDHGDFLIA